MRATLTTAALPALFAIACANEQPSPQPELGSDSSLGDLSAQDAAVDLTRDALLVLREASVDTRADSRFVCDPPAASGSIYELSASTALREISMCEFRDRALLVVNIAAK